MVGEPAVVDGDGVSSAGGGPVSSECLGGGPVSSKPLATSTAVATRSPLDVHAVAEPGRPRGKSRQTSATNAGEYFVVLVIAVHAAYASSVGSWQ